MKFCSTGYNLLATLLFVLPAIFSETAQAKNHHPSPQSPELAQAVEFPAMVVQALQVGARLEADAQWADALKIYDNALRAYPDVKPLQQRFNYVRLHRDITRRYADVEFRQTCSEMSSEQVSEFIYDVLKRFTAYYVADLTPSQIFARELNGVEIALENKLFRECFLPGVPDSVIVAYRREAREILVRRTLNELADVYDATLALGVLSRQYFQQMPASVVVVEAMCGLVNTLDPYSGILTPTQLRDTQSSIRGTFTGLGIEIRTQLNSVFIQRVIPGSPAERAGIRAGDVILEINGNPLSEKGSAEKAAILLQNQKQSSVQMRLQWETDAPRTISIKRDRIVMPPLENAHVIPRSDGVAYIRIPAFQEGSAVALEAELWKLYDAGMKSLILDLRGNPGGPLTAAAEMADIFIADGVIVSTMGKNRKHDQYFMAKQRGTWRVPLVVLIDGESASAAEIFAGAISEHKRGRIVGQRSFGKGSVQGIFQLSGSKFGIKLTTSLFYSPNGQKYNQVGVAPDILVHSTAKPALEDTSPAVGRNVDDTVRHVADNFHVLSSPGSTDAHAAVYHTAAPESDRVLEVAIRVLNTDN